MLIRNYYKQKNQRHFPDATLFWTVDEAWKTGLKLENNFADRLPEEVPIFFYHAREGEELPFFSHFEQYKQKLARATFREVPSGGHQLDNDLAPIAEDIRSLALESKI